MVVALCEEGKTETLFKFISIEPTQTRCNKTYGAHLSFFRRRKTNSASSEPVFIALFRLLFHACVCVCVGGRLTSRCGQCGWFISVLITGGHQPLAKRDCHVSVSGMLMSKKRHRRKNTSVLFLLGIASFSN